MKKLLICLLLLPSLAWGSDLGQDYARMNPYILGGGASAADYCASQTWNTFTAFRLDFDHTTDTKTACLASGTQVGTEEGTPTIGTVSPSTATLGSGGNVIYTNATAEYLHFDNNSSIFQSQYGELKLKLNMTDNNAAGITIFSALGVAAQDKLNISVSSTGIVAVYWEDHNGTDVIANALDLDTAPNYGDWIQIHAKWDTTRCEDAGDTCDTTTANGDWTQAGEDELCIRYRVDADGNGAWDSPGASGNAYWSSWVCETSAINLEPFATEPGDNDLIVGIYSGTFDYAVWVDDIEISVTQPSQ